MTASAFARFGVSCAAQPRGAGRQTTGLAKPRQVGRGATSNNGAALADLAQENGAVNGVHVVHNEGVAQIAVNGGSVLARVPKGSFWGITSDQWGGLPHLGPGPVD